MNIREQLLLTILGTFTYSSSGLFLLIISLLEIPTVGDSLG